MWVTDARRALFVLTRLHRNLIFLCAAVVAFLALSAAPAAAKPPCWSTLINDWYDGQIDSTYPIPCYRQALAHLPTAIDTYSSARDDINRALQFVIHHPGKKPPPPTGGAKGGHKGSGDGSPVKDVFKKIGPKNADSVPIPLLVLGGIALLLLALGGAGFLARRLQARRLPPSSPALPPGADRQLGP